MGTRGAVGFKLNDKYYVSYNHFDSYPDGLGNKVVEFIQHVNNEQNWDALKERVAGITLVSEDSIPTPTEIELYAGYANTAVGNQKLDDWYCLLRNMQFGKFLWEVENGNLQHMIDNFEFMRDSLFCEYAYIINLDDMKLDYYLGFQTAPSNNGLPFPMVADNKYYPVALRKRFSLKRMSKNWLKAMNSRPRVKKTA